MLDHGSFYLNMSQTSHREEWVEADKKTDLDHWACDTETIDKILRQWLSISMPQRNTGVPQ